MEKNIRKRVCRLAAVLSAVLVVFFNFLSYFGLCSLKSSGKFGGYLDNYYICRRILHLILS